MIVIVKLGGSLFDLPDLQDRLARFIDQRLAGQNVLLVPGGGMLVEAVRQYDAIHQLDPIRCHWLCVELMATTAKMLHTICNQWPLIESVDALKLWLSRQTGINKFAGTQHPHVAIVTPTAYYTQQIHADALPVSWETTSDSISILLARTAQAQKLILLKSTDESVEGIASIVDANFHRLQPEQFKPEIVNFRSWCGAN